MYNWHKTQSQNTFTQNLETLIFLTFDWRRFCESFLWYLSTRSKILTHQWLNMGWFDTNTVVNLDINLHNCYTPNAINRVDCNGWETVTSKPNKWQSFINRVVNRLGSHRNSDFNQAMSTFSYLTLLPGPHLYLQEIGVNPDF